MIAWRTCAHRAQDRTRTHARIHCRPLRHELVLPQLQIAIGGRERSYRSSASDGRELPRLRSLPRCSWLPPAPSSVHRAGPVWCGVTRSVGRSTTTIFGHASFRSSASALSTPHVAAYPGIGIGLPRAYQLTSLPTDFGLFAHHLPASLRLAVSFSSKEAVP